jgi:putative solute:sodium symporter small subunit
MTITENRSGAAPGDPPAPSAQQPAPLRTLRAAYWRRTRTLTGTLLLIWFTTGFCTVFFARELAGITLFGWPLSFYLAAQGMGLIYLAILAVYAWRMRRLDLQFKELERSL